jgi:hypothetical protein
MLRNRIFIVTLLFSMLACSQASSPPGRPDGVPSNAMWIGGVDGGAWVVVSKPADQPPHVYYGEIYGDQAGDKWYVGRLALHPPNDPVLNMNDPETFGMWDGDNLLLNDGRVLKAMDPFNPFGSK